MDGNKTVTVRATSTAATDIKAEYTFAPLPFMTASPETVSLTLGEEGGVIDTELGIFPATYTGLDLVKWGVENPALGTLSAANGVTHFTAKRPGTTQVTVENRYFSGQKVEIPVTIKGVAVETKTAGTATTLKRGETLQLAAFGETVGETFTWVSGDDAIASVDSGGKVTALSRKGGGVTVYAVSHRSTAEAEIKGGLWLYVKPDPTVYVKGISLSPATLTLKNGQSTKLSATVTPANATTQAVSWKSNNTKVVRISGSGANVTVKAVGKGSTTITAASQDGSGVTKVCKVTVKQPVAKVALNKKSATLKKGKSLRLKASVTPKNANVKTLKWTSSKPKVAKVTTKGLKNGTSKVTALKKGTTTITAMAKDGSKKKATCKIKVK